MPLCFFQIHVFFFVNCCYMHICLYTHLFLNTTFSVYIRLLVWIFSELIVWYWVTSWCVLAWLPIVLCVVLKPCLSPIHFGMSVVVLVQLMLRQSNWLDFMCVSSDIIERHNLTTNSLIIWPLQSFHPRFHNVPIYILHMSITNSSILSLFI